MTIARRIGLLLLLACLGVSIWWGSSIARTVPGGPLDFQAIYYGARCLIQHHNPYKVSELDALYQAEGGEHPSDSLQRRQTVTLYVNLPVTFLFIAPFTMLPLELAQVLWTLGLGQGDGPGRHRRDRSAAHQAGLRLPGCPVRCRAAGHP